MTMKNQLHLLLAIGLILFSGCTWYTSGPSQEASIEFSGSINASEGGFVMDGELVNYGQESHQFRNVTVYLYDENKTLVSATPLGALQDDPLSTTVQSDRLPKYVIIYSEEFWDVDEFQVYYFVQTNRSDTSYREHVAGSIEDLPVIPGTEMNTTTGRS